MPVLERSELFRFLQKVPRKEGARYLNALGRGKEYHDALESEVGQRLVAHVGDRIQVVENAILEGKEKELYPGTADPALEARAEYRVLQGHAKYILSEINRYYKLMEDVKKTAGPDPATNNG